MNKIYSYIKLVRPLNCLITAAVVFVGGIISSENKTFNETLILASITAAFIAASGNVINDYFDIEIDKIAHRERPMVKGEIKPSEALRFYFVLIIIGFVISFFLHLNLLIITFLSAAILFLYSYFIKKILLIGNIVVALLTAIAFIFGGLAVNNPKAAIIPAIFAFMINLIRELVKDIQDIEGDKLNNTITFPVKFGIRNTSHLIIILIFILIGFTFYPYFTQIYRIEYFIIVMLSVNPLLVYVIKYLTISRVKNFQHISSILKINMIFGLIAIYLGA